MNEEISFSILFLNFQIPLIISLLNKSNRIISNETQNILSNLERLSNVILCCNDKNESFNDSNIIKNEKNHKKEIKKKNLFYSLSCKVNIIFNILRIRKRMYQVDCLTKKINVNFFNYMKENKKELGIERNILVYLKKNIKVTSKIFLKQLKKKYPKINEYFNSFINSDKFKQLMRVIDEKNDKEYRKLFESQLIIHQTIFNSINKIIVQSDLISNSN